MNTKYPFYYIYEELYKRYFKRSVKDLIDLGNVKKTDKVLDLCGGNGRLTKELIKLSSDVSYLDGEKDMIPKEIYESHIKIYNMKIQDFIKINNYKFDKVFCQQAINYWLLNIDIKSFCNLFNKGGLFIFNTFANKPNEKPVIKEYEIDGKSFIEISYLINNKVNHIQIKEGLEPHYTMFDYISEDKFNELLSPYFKIEIIKDNNTLIYKCERR